MRKILFTLLAIVLVLGVLGAAGFAGYQYGYRQGVTASTDGNAQVAPRSGDFNPHGMPMHNFGFDHGFGRGFGMMHGGMGFGFFSPLFFLARIAFWALILWAIYLLITRSGWRLTRTSTPVETVAPPSNVENKEE